MQRSNLTNIFVFLLLFCFSLLIFGFDKLELFNPVKQAAGFVTNPVQGGIYNLTKGITRNAAFFLEIKKTSEDFEKLKGEYAKLLVQTQKLKAVQDENTILRAQYESDSTNSNKMLPAHVIGFPKSQNLILDKGSTSGVKVKDVATLENSYIGEVVSVTPNTSTVRLPIDSQSSLSVYVDRTGTGPKGVIRGSFGSIMILEKILPSEKLNQGDVVLTAGEEEAGNIPKGLIIGKVSQIKKEEAAVFQTAEVEPLWPYAELSMVFLRSN